MSELEEFEEALDTLIQLKLMKTNEEQIREHFGGVTICEYIKLVIWSFKNRR